MLTGTGSFDGGVECQQIGLVGDFLNGAGDDADLLGTVAETLDRVSCILDPNDDAVHYRDGLVHDLGARNRRLAGVAGTFGGNMAVLGNIP